MPKSFNDLVRESVFRPKNAARYVVDLELPKSVIIQASLLMSIIATGFQYASIVFSTEMSNKDMIPIIPNPLLDVALQFVAIYVVNVVIVMLARGLGIKVDFYEAVKVYIWFNFVLSLMIGTMFLGVFALGPFITLLGLGLMVWVPYMIMSFWSVLFGSKLGVGLVIPVVAFLVASMVTSIFAQALGLPLMGYYENV